MEEVEVNQDRNFFTQAPLFRDDQSMLLGGHKIELYTQCSGKFLQKEYEESEQELEGEYVDET